MDIQVGDRVTYKFENNTGILKEIIKNETEAKDFKKKNIKILKIERPKYEVIEEKKELLTEEEKEFLKFFLRFYKIAYFVFNDADIEMYDKNNHIINCPDYPEKLKFKNVERKIYSIKELGLEE